MKMAAITSFILLSSLATVIGFLQQSNVASLSPRTHSVEHSQSQPAFLKIAFLTNVETSAPKHGHFTSLNMLELPASLNQASMKPELPKPGVLESMKLDLPTYFDPASIKIELPASFYPSSMKLQLSTYFDPSSIKLDIPAYLDPTLIKTEIPKYLHQNTLKFEIPSYFDPGSMRFDLPSFDPASINMIELSSPLVPAALMLFSMALLISMAEPRVESASLYDVPFTETEEVTEDVFEATETHDSPVVEPVEELPLTQVENIDEEPQKIFESAQEPLIEESVGLTTVIGSDSDEVAVSAQTEDDLDKSSSVVRSESIILKCLGLMFNGFGTFFTQLKRWRASSELRETERYSTVTPTPPKKTESFILKAINLSFRGLQKVTTSLRKKG